MLKERAHTKRGGLLPVPSAPVVVVSLMAHSRAHLASTERQQIDMGPMRLDVFTVCSPNVLEEVERESGMRLATVDTVVLLRDREPNLLHALMG